MKRMERATSIGMMAWTKSGVLAIWLTLVCFGCEEKLPLYEQPQQFVKASLSRDGEPNGTADTLSTVRVLHHCGEYSATYFKVGLKNLYDETLSGNRNLIVKIEIDGLDPRLPLHRELSRDFSGPGQIIINPGQTYSITIPWDRRDEAGHLIDTGVDSTYFRVPSEVARESPPIKFRLRATIQVWKEVPPMPTNEFVLKLIFFTGGACFEGYVE